MTNSTEHEEPEARITPRLIDGFYTEAMILADEARAYFDDLGRADRVVLDPFARVGFACESLKVTTRIMHIVAWLLTQRAVESGEILCRRPAPSGAAAGPCQRQRSVGGRAIARVGAAADPRQRRPLCSG